MHAFSDLEQDALAELMNIAAGRAANAMSRLFGLRVYMHIARIRLLSHDEVRDFLAKEVGTIGSITAQNFFGDLNGIALMVIPYDHAAQLVRILTEEQAPFLHMGQDSSVLAELSNIVLSACVSTLVKQLDAAVRFRLPQVKVNLQSTQASAYITSLARNLHYQVLLLSTHLTIGNHHLETHIMIMLVVDAAEMHALLHKLIVKLD